MQQQVVIDTATSVVKRAGYCDFENDGSFSPGTETLLVEGTDYAGDVFFEPRIDQALWTWTGSAFAQGATLDLDAHSALLVIRQPFVAAAPGAADDVVIYNANAPFGFRILDSQVLISTAIGGSTVQLRSATGGGGVALSDAFPSAAQGRLRDGATGIANATKTVAIGGTLALRRSDRGAAGEVILFCTRGTS